MINTYLISFKTILYKEVTRFMRIWIQTILPPVITSSLYFIIFGHFIGNRIGEIQGFNYMQYIAPGLIMLAVITNSYGNVVSSFFSARLLKNIEEILISPTPNIVFLLGYVFAGVIRGIVVGIAVTIVALFFTHLTVHSSLITISIVVLSAMLFSLAGFTNAIYAKKFDDISIVPTFVLTPLTYLGGIFYSIHLLPSFWFHVSYLNPILYMVNTFRFGILGISDINISVAFSLLIAMISILFVVNLYLLAKGTGLRS
jgi:ABC-2 type transport system permease protein